MAKRPTSKTKPTDPAAPAEPKPRRTRRTAPAESSRDTASDREGPAAPSVEDIRRRAYERYLERGGNHGRHFDDWLEAEKELKTRK